MREHKVSFDLLRILACFCVIMNHTLWDVVEHTSFDGTKEVAIALYTFSKIAVPLFLMISGALLFQKEYRLKDIYIKKIGKLLLIMLLFAFFIWVFIFENGYNIMDFLAYLYEQPISPAYWYVYLLLGIYMAMPFLYRLFHAMKKQDFHYLFALSFLFLGILPYLPGFYEGTLKLSSSFHIPFLASDLLYLAFGFYIKKFGVPFPKRKHIILWGLSITTFVGSTLYAIQEIKQGSKGIIFDNTSIFTVMILAGCIFCLSYDWQGQKRMNLRWVKILKQVGASTFGIYLSHGILMHYMRMAGVVDITGIDPLFDQLLFDFYVFLFGFILVQVLGCMPFFRSLLHLPKR